MGDLVSAVRDLRAAFGDNQQDFARRAGLSMRAIANYEKDRAPSAKALFQFAKLASQINRPDLSSKFSVAFQSEVGENTIDPSDDLQRSALVAIHQNNGPEWLENQLMMLIREARKDKPLTYPLLYDLNHAPNQNSRITYLEGLLVDLRMRTAESATVLLEEMAAERAEQTGESKERAYLEILTQNPALYARYNQERADAARGTSLAPSMAVYGTRQHAEVQAKKAKTKRGKKL